MTPRSNLNGRLLEYLITDVIIQNCHKVNLTVTDRADKDQRRDICKLAEIDSLLLDQLKLAANALFTKWLNPRFKVFNQSSIVIDRLPDKNGNDVTDISLTSPSWKVNLSIKHNNKALRHQRPRTTPLHCGYHKDSLEMKQFKEKYLEITLQFIQHIGGVKVFSELPYSLIDQHLYTPICNLVSQFINNHASICTVKLFQYLVSIDYYKINVDTRKQTLNIQEFAEIMIPNSVQVSVNKQYVNLSFNNGWDISMRLHTASSKIGKSPSLKFDTQAKNSPVNTITIPYV